MLRHKRDFPYAAVSLALNAWMLSRPGEWLGRISCNLNWHTPLQI
jgi:hypothetical protein